MADIDREARFLDRASAAEFLTAMGLKTTAATLSTVASRGNGPIYFIFGRRALYRESDLLSWAETRLGEPATTHSQRLANKAA